MFDEAHETVARRRDQLAIIGARSRWRRVGTPPAVAAGGDEIVVYKRAADAGR